MRNYCKELLVGVMRFELTTPATPRQYSTGLSYTPTEISRHLVPRRYAQKICAHWRGMTPLQTTHYTLPTIFVVFKFPNRNRVISTSRLNTLRCVHLKPINVIISHDPQTIPYLEAGFPLRCFQWLSIPDIVTRQCRGCDSRYARGQFIPVLSY